MRRLSRTESWGNTPPPCGIIASPRLRVRCDGRWVTSSSSIVTRPAHGSITPTMAFSRVLFPQPFGPKMQVTSPVRAVIDTWCRICTLPYPASRPSTVTTLSLAAWCSLTRRHPQISLHHVGIVRDLRKAALRHDLSGIHHDDPVADVLGELHVVLDHQKRCARVTQGADGVEHDLAQSRVDTGGDLVQQRDLRVLHQHPTHLQQALLPAGQGAREVVGDVGELQPLQHG